jgi:hypothetical protein
MPTLRNKRPEPFTQRILAGPGWFGDGPPQWREGVGKCWEKFSKTASDVNQMRRDAANLLCRFGTGDASIQNLGERMRACSRRSPCTSGACPSCGRAYQRWWVANCQKLMVRGIEGGIADLLMVTISPDFGRLPLPNLNSDSVREITAKLRRILSQAGVSVAFGGVDFCVNADAEGETLHLQVHYCLFVPGSSWLKCYDKLLTRINASGDILRPIRAKSFDGNAAGLAYSLKYRFQRRECYWQLPESRADGRGCWNTRLRPLRGPARVNLMVMLDGLGLSDRVVLMGVRRIRKGKVVVLRESK